MTILVTGATSGIGFATAIRLAHSGCDVALVGRTSASADQAATLVRAAAPEVTVTAFAGDLARPAEVASLASVVIAAHPRLMAAVFCAGVVNPDDAVVDGLDATLAVNHLAPAILAQRLDTTLHGGRMVLVSSSQHGSAGRFDPRVFDQPGNASSRRRYVTSKLLNLLYAAGRTHHPHDSPLASVDPGFVRTRLGRRATGPLKALLTITRPIQDPPSVPATLIAERLSAVDFEDGGYYSRRGMAKASPNAVDPESIASAWEWTRELIATQLG